jgi:hypothetical protein
MRRCGIHLAQVGIYLHGSGYLNLSIMVSVWHCCLMRSECVVLLGMRDDGKPRNVDQTSEGQSAVKHASLQRSWPFAVRIRVAVHSAVETYAAWQSLP